MIAIESQAIYQRPILTPELERQADDLFRSHVESSVVGDGNQTIPFRKIIELAEETIGQLHITGQRKDQMSIATSLLWERYVLMLPPDDPRRKEYDIQIYNGCEHGVLPGMQERVNEIKPDNYWRSDITGSTFEGKSKIIYYNEIINRVRPFAKDMKAPESLVELLRRQPDNLLQSVTDAIFKLHIYLWSFEGRDPGYIFEQTESWNEQKIGEWLYAQLQPKMNHGYWLGSLERETREKIVAEIEERVRAAVAASQLPENTEQFNIGNWDMSESLDIILKGKKNIDHPGDLEPIKTTFSTIDFLKELGKNVYTQITAIETPSTLTIVAPFPALRTRTVLPDFPNSFDINSLEVQGALRQAEDARSRGKLVVIYAHASLEHLEAGPDNGDVARNLLILMKAIGPDLVVYPHEHQVRKTKEGKIIDDNVHTVYDYFHDQAAVNRWDNGSFVVTDINSLGKDGQTVTVYLPALNDTETDLSPRTAIGIYPVNPAKAARRNLLLGRGGLAPQLYNSVHAKQSKEKAK